MLNVSQASRLLGISEWTVRKLIRDRKLAATKSSNKQGYDIPEQEVEHYKAAAAEKGSRHEAVSSFEDGMETELQELQQMTDRIIDKNRRILFRYEKRQPKDQLLSEIEAGEIFSQEHPEYSDAIQTSIEKKKQLLLKIESLSNNLKLLQTLQF